MNDMLYIINNYHKSGNLEMDAIKVKNVFINYNITEWNITLQLQKKHQTIVWIKYKNKGLGICQDLFVCHYYSKLFTFLSIILFNKKMQMITETTSAIG